MHFFKGRATAIYKNPERIDQETQRKYGGVFRMELSDFAPVRDGEGEKPERFELAVPQRWGDTYDALKDLLDQEIFFPYRKTVANNKTFYYVLDGAERPKPNHPVTVRLGDSSISQGEAE